MWRIAAFSATQSNNHQTDAHRVHVGDGVGASYWTWCSKTVLSGERSRFYQTKWRRRHLCSRFWYRWWVRPQSRGWSIIQDNSGSAKVREISGCSCADNKFHSWSSSALGDALVGRRGPRRFQTYDPIQCLACSKTFQDSSSFWSWIYNAEHCGCLGKIRRTN